MAGILEANKKKELGIDEGEVLFHGEALNAGECMFGDDNYEDESFQIMVIATKIGRIVETTYNGKDLRFGKNILTGDKVELVIHDRYSASWEKKE